MAKRRGFVVWDAELTEVRDMIVHAGGKGAVDDVEVKDLCASEDTREGEIHANVVDALRDADRIIGVTDRANADVGFELGFAWGRGRDVVLCGSNVAVNDHAWLSRQPLLAHSVAPLTSTGELIDLVRRSSDFAAPAVAQLGEGVRILCPDERMGADFRATCAAEFPETRLAPPVVRSIDAVDALLVGIGTVVWIVPRMPAPPGHRDHPAVAMDAVLAGFAFARGRALHVFQPTPSGADPHRRLADVVPQTPFWSDPDDLFAKLSALLLPATTPTPQAPRDVLETYFDFLRRRHARLIPFGDASTGDVVELCDVEVCVGSEVRGADGSPQRPGRKGATVSGGEGLLERLEPVKLEKLLADRPQGRFLLAGEPGAGKSTLVRHLAFVSARAERVESDRTVVFVSLSRWAVEGGDLFGWVEADAVADRGEAARGLAARLQALSDEPGRLWLLLDGLDEVRQNLAAVVEKVTALARTHEGALVVTTRPRTDAPFGTCFEPLSMRPLGPDAQRSLLTHWLRPAGFDPVVAWHRIRDQPRLAELAGNPLMLTLLAILVREREELPPTRVKLYERAVDVLLSRWHESDDGKRRLKNVVTAKRVLPELALWLQQRGGEVWDREGEVEDAMWAYKKLDEEGYARVQSDWQAHADFLDEVQAVSGLFGPLDGDRKQWRFLHRSFREYLAAVALAKRPDAVEALVEPAWQAASHEVRRPVELTVSGWWGETCAMLAGLVPRPIDLLTRLHAKDKSLLDRVVRAAEKLPVSETLDCLWGLGVRDDLVPFVVVPIQSSGDAERDLVAKWLWA